MFLLYINAYKIYYIYIKNLVKIKNPLTIYEISSTNIKNTFKSNTIS